MQELNQLISKIPIPRMMWVRQRFDRAEIPREQIPERIFGILAEEKLASRIAPGMRIAIPAGSRQICHMDAILAAVVAALKARGAEPFIVPAMGSHGGATAQGQEELLRGYSITEATCGCPIRSSMEVVPVGRTEDGRTVCLDRLAAEADGILVIGRVKAHTGFRGRYESGIMKMMAIGLGNQQGAEECHRQGFGKMAENIELFGNAILAGAKILGAIAILENAFDRLHELIGLAPEEIPEREPELLLRAKTLMPRILLPACDVLIVDEIGKNYSGAGMDPNVTGRHLTPYASGGLRSQQVVVLGLSEKSHHNGYGIGVADCTTVRVFRELNLQSMYINGITCLEMTGCRIPCVYDNDRLAIQASIKMCAGLGTAGPRIIRIRNTLQLEMIQVSENYAAELQDIPELSVAEGPEDLRFDREGWLIGR